MLKAIFRFENLDSTRDLNDRFKGLFKKGVYEGGVVKTGVTGTTAIVEPFKAMSYDGMAVEMDDEYVVNNIPMNTVVYIVLNAVYNIGEEPTLEIKAVSESDIESHPWYVKLGKRIGASSSSYNYIDEDCADRIDPVGRNHFKGTYNQAQLAGEWESFAKFDWCFLMGNQEMKIVVKDGDGNRVEFTATTYIDRKINNHIKNIVENEIEDSGMGDANSPSFSEAPLIIRQQGSTRLCDLGTDAYGSYHITSDKWFSTETVLHKWQGDIGTGGSGAYTHDETQDYCRDGETVGKFIQQYYERDSHSDGVRFVNLGDGYWYNLNNVALPSQRPSVDNRYITEGFVRLPTLDEKWALVGSIIYDEYKPGKDNKFLVEKTPFITLKKKTLVRDTSITDKFAYILNDVNDTDWVYLCNAESSTQYIRPILSNNATVNFDTGNFSIKVKNGNNYETLDDSYFEPVTGNILYRTEGFLKQGYRYYIFSDVELSGLYYYVAGDYTGFINNEDMQKPAIISDEHELIITKNLRANLSYINTLYGKNVIIENNTETADTPYLNVSANYQDASHSMLYVSRENYTPNGGVTDIVALMNKGIVIYKDSNSKCHVNASEIFMDVVNLRATYGIRISGLTTDNNTSGNLYFETENNKGSNSAYLYVRGTDLMFHTKNANNVEKDFKVLLFEEV